ncbi:hypothetical protein CTX74_11775 [Salmonella enterica subsp. enterica serovar Infantis]|nr:hypothetical protein [Salmonella enterica subsp. enterica serovar Infantis]EDL8669130.1 hypothetical protein [Salmonella enterica subsp. enterica serovar Infantis]
MARITDNKKDAFGVWCRRVHIRVSTPGTRFMRCGVNVTQFVYRWQALFYGLRKLSPSLFYGLTKLIFRGFVVGVALDPETKPGTCS